MTKNTPRIFISLLLMLLCIGILPVSAFASGGDYPMIAAAESSAADAGNKTDGTVTTNGGNLKSAPARTGHRVYALPNGTVVDVIGRDGDWVNPAPPVWAMCTAAI